MAFITKRNFNKIFNAISNSDAFDKMTLDAKIYPDIEFAFFNQLERKQLLEFKAFVSDPDFYITQYLKAVKIDQDNSYFLNVENIRPAYHSDSTCERLLSDFVGYPVPDCIKAQGPVAVAKFKEFYKEHLDLFNTNMEAFEARASILFKVSVRMEMLTLPNSGVKEVEDFRQYDVKMQILELWNDMHKWLDMNPGSTKRKILYLKFGTRTFLVTNPKYKDIPIQYTYGNSEEEVRSFLSDLYNNYKKPIMDLLRKFYMVEYNPDLEMNQTLLDRLGFVPCKHCC